MIEASGNIDIQDITQLLCRERQERLKSNRQVSTNLKRSIKNGRSTIHISLSNLPRLSIRNVFVTDARNIHSLLKSLAEVESLNVLLKSLLARNNLCKSLAVHSLRLEVSRDSATEVLLSQDNSPVNEVTEDSHKLAVVTLLEILPGKVIILSLRSIGAKNVTQHILLTGELLKILVKPNSPVTGSRNLIALKVQELVGRNIVRKNVTIAVGLQH